MDKVELQDEKLLALMGKIAAVLEKEPALQQKLELTDSIEVAYEIFKPYLENATMADFAAACVAAKKMTNETQAVSQLSDDELEDVTGGSFWSDFKKGFVGTFKVIGSALLFVGAHKTNSPLVQDQVANMLKNSVKELSDALHGR